MALFVQTRRLKDSFALISGVDETRLALLLGRILVRLCVKKSTVLFSEEEQTQLLEVLDISKLTDLNTVIDAVSYIFEQAAYRTCNAQVLVEQLKEAGLTQTHADVFGSSWAEKGPGFVSFLKEKSFGAPQVLNSVDWRLHLQMGQSSLFKSQDLKSVFSFGLNTDNSGENKCVNVEFDEDQLFELYSKLEKVQEQLDALT